jgi:hypothetical protein
MYASRPAKDLTPTAFLRWRQLNDLSVNEAADLLGLSVPQIHNLDRGATPWGQPSLPKRDTRLLMTAAAQKIALEPWPI